MSGRPTTPLVTVDVIIEMKGGVVLIERKHPPLGWALPGGFVDVGESLAAAAVREAREETSLEVELSEQFFAYSDPARDPRGATVSVVYLAHAEGTPRGADDAKEARLFSLEALPTLAFDHGRILEDYRSYRAANQRPPVER
jgi:8-oxo-dGTP diphosphatase